MARKVFYHFSQTTVALTETREENLSSNTGFLYKRRRRSQSKGTLGGVLTAGQKGNLFTSSGVVRAYISRV